MVEVVGEGVGWGASKGLALVDSNGRAGPLIGGAGRGWGAGYGGCGEYASPRTFVGIEWPLLMSDIEQVPEHHRPTLVRALQEMVISYDMMSGARRVTLVAVAEV